LGERQSVSLNGGDPEEIKNAIWNECGKIAKNNFKKILAKLRNCKNSSDVSKALYGKIFKIKGKSYSAHEALLDGPEDANLQRDAKKYLKELGKVVDKLIKAESKASKQSTEKEISLDSLNRLKMHRSEIRKRIDSTHSGRAMIDLKSSTHFPKDD
jgi:hypothetical protein